MNLLFLVEGEQTEKLLYRAWIKHWFASLKLVQNPSELLGDRYCVISGGGQPRVFERIRDLLADVRDNPAIDHFFVCVDSEERSREEALATIEDCLARGEVAAGVRQGNTSFRAHAIVQHCCVETWLLGHSKMIRRSPQSAVLRRFKAFYDVGVEDPELMDRLPGFGSRAHSHFEYLREMFREQGLNYSKKKPGEALEGHYLAALRQRHRETRHLPSMGKLIDILDGLLPP